MLVFDFFSGTGSSTKAFKEAGHTVVSFEIDPSFNATETRDVLTLTAEYLIEKYGRPDFIWASPPCTAFSVASIGHHWSNLTRPPSPKTEAAVFNQTLVAHTRSLIEKLEPRHGFIMENPRGMLRKLEVVAGLPRVTVTYCQYGDFRQKPTDLWGGVEGWTPKPMCQRGMPCHEAAPRGAKSGSQRIKGATLRSMIPYGLSEEIYKAVLKLEETK